MKGVVMWSEGKERDVCIGDVPQRWIILGEIKYLVWPVIRYNKVR